jgi:hypothetical protein
MSLKNFCAGLELITVLVTNPVTLRTPERIELATLLDIFVTLLALNKTRVISRLLRGCLQVDRFN